MNDVYRAAKRVVIMDSSPAEKVGMLAKSNLFVLKDALLDFEQFELVLALSRQYDTLLGMLAKK
ncbi:hypothetical protein QQX98_002525 [Neonectria punicea]|uniref:Uncharacterized protein n=1 Tax=Neonectria punicea TaxID=979145 RepID=A0ABR1HIE8_9HYPO